MCTCQEQIIICLFKHEIAGVIICMVIVGKQQSTQQQHRVYSMVNNQCCCHLQWHYPTITTPMTTPAISSIKLYKKSPLCFILIRVMFTVPVMVVIQGFLGSHCESTTSQNVSALLHWSVHIIHVISSIVSSFECFRASFDQTWY